MPVDHADNAEHVYIEQRFGLRQRGFLGATEQANASIVDQELNVPGLGQNVLDQLRHGHVIGPVAGQHGYAVGSFGGRAPTGAEHMIAGLLQGLGGCVSDTGGCPCHQGDAGIGLFLGSHFFRRVGLA
ncbi:hypothetical protein C8N35_104119 [Breoghania corrubedonensis]|uniref:Uncharacterized protein n=1 Tax=Breoghania corrubedonensis TaxID=665038 RepID=A0A2T5V9R2_9HYPH|nr:hypothetical protein C8N35_104119 [Breoghania corrubedonensis]